jgi:hypothetical protein
MTEPLSLVRDEGPAPEPQIAADLARRALYVAPVLLGVSWAVWGIDGAISTGYAMAIVVANFALAAGILAWTARISLALLMAGAMFGFLLRLALIFIAVWLVQDATWFEPVPLGLTIIVTHLGLLFWETRYVSASLAFPALKPRA